MNTMEMKQKLKTMYLKSENWARKDQLVDMVNDLRRQLSDYKSSHFV